jgi:hypothetical protein
VAGLLHPETGYAAIAIESGHLAPRFDADRAEALVLACQRIVPREHRNVLQRWGKICQNAPSLSSCNCDVYV